MRVGVIIYTLVKKTLETINKMENYNSVRQKMMPNADLGFDQTEILKSTLCSKLYPSKCKHIK